MSWGQGVWGQFAWGPFYAALSSSATSLSIVTVSRASELVLALSRDSNLVESRSTALPYLMGNIIVLDFEAFQSSSGWVSPNQVTLTIKPPSGANIVVSSPTVVATGKYRHLFDTEGLAAGTYRYRWQGNGVYECANEGSFEILASEVL